jgi:hypothetical protein
LTTSLDPDSVLAEARQRSGLDDFGAGFHEPLVRLLRSLDEEANLNEIGRATQRERTVSILVTRARVEDWFKRHPEIAEEQIGAPLVICGLPRTGTTMLHRVISEDPEFDSAKWYEVRFPAPFDGWEPGELDARIPAAQEEVRQTLELAPELMAIHPFDALGPDEEIMLLEQSFYSATPESYCQIPSFSKWIEYEDNLPAYRYLHRMLQFLQWQHRQEGRARDRWVLKAPHHLHYMKELFSLFPDATVVQTHRDPAQSIPSICSLCYYLETMGADEVDPVATGTHWNAKWARALHRCLEYRDQGHDDRFIDIWYLDSVKDPVGVVRRVYESVGRELTSIAEEKMRHWTEENARDKRATHAYTLERFGLSEETIAADFARYRERYILSRGEE